MAKKASNKKTPQRSLLSILIAVIVLIGAALSGLLPNNNAPVPGTPATVTTGAGNVPTNPPASGNATFTPLPVDIATLAPVTSAPGQVSIINVAQCFGASKSFWQMYFT